MEKRIGKISWWNRSRNCGVVSCRTGIKIENFFLHLSQIEICQPIVPDVECIVRFEIDLNHPPKRSNQFYGASHAEVYFPRPEIQINAGLESLSGDEPKAGE